MKIIMKKIISICIIAFLIFACSNEINSDIIEINIPEALERKPEKILLSQIANDIDYVFLETNDSCFIGRIRSMDISENYILILH